MDWHPLLIGADRERALERVREIAGDLHTRVDEHDDFPGLAGGLGGFALFFQYVDAAFPDEGYDEIAIDFLHRTVTQLSHGGLALGLFGGYSGIGWLCDHLGATEGEIDPNQRIDDLVVDALVKPWEDQLDLVNGLVGLGVYALQRDGRGAGPVIIERVVEQLENLAVERHDGITWHTPARLLVEWQRAAYPNGYYNLGLAHGVPGVLAVLARANARSDLVDGVVRWLLAQAENGSDASYGACVTDTMREPATRSAWCYGDPGVAIALLGAAITFDRPQWRDAGIALARGVARRSREAIGCRDAGLCHGTAGLGHILNRAYQVTHDEELGDAARGWIRETLATRVQNAVGGFREAPPTHDEARWEETAGFLTGAAGIGLALLAAATDVPPEWDRVMLLDVGH